MLLQSKSRVTRSVLLEEEPEDYMDEENEIEAEAVSSSAVAPSAARSHTHNSGSPSLRSESHQPTVSRHVFASDGARDLDAKAAHVATAGNSLRQSRAEVIKSTYVEEDMEEDLGQETSRGAMPGSSDVPLVAEPRNEPQVSDDVFAILKSDVDESIKHRVDVDAAIGPVSSPSMRQVVVLATASSAIAVMFVMLVGWCFFKRSLLAKAKTSFNEDMMEWALHYEPEERQLEAAEVDACPALVAVESNAQQDQPQSEQQVYLQTEPQTEQEANLQEAVEELVHPSQPDPEVQLLTEQEANLHMAVDELCNHEKGGKGEKGDDILSAESQLVQECLDPESEPEPYSD